MTGRRPRASAALAACFSCIGPPLVGQTSGALELGASLVEYEGFLRSGAGVLSSTVRYDAADVSLGGQGSWTAFESGNQILQATGAGAWQSPLRGRWRFELAGAVGAAKYAAEPASGHLLARTRIHFFRERTGAWIGATTGGSFGGDFAGVPLELSIAAWSARDHLSLVGTLTGVRLGGDGYLDVTGVARWTGGRLDLEAQVGARPWTGSQQVGAEAHTDVYGDLSLLVSLGQRIGLALSGGSYPSDPVRRVLGANHITAGLRLIIGPEAAPHPTIADARVGAVRDRAAAGSTSRARLEIAPAGDQRALRVHVLGATSVELMGDFTDWQPVPLRQTGPDTWEVQLPLTSGVHRVNVRIDEGPWLVPAGARPEQSEFGGTVGVIVVR